MSTDRLAADLREHAKHVHGAIVAADMRAAARRLEELEHEVSTLRESWANIGPSKVGVPAQGREVESISEEVDPTTRNKMLTALLEQRWKPAQEALQRLLPSIPHGTDWHAHRYDTDDSMKLVLWRGDETLDYSCAKEKESAPIQQQMPCPGFPDCECGKPHKVDPEGERCQPLNLNPIDVNCEHVWGDTFRKGGSIALPMVHECCHCRGQKLAHICGALHFSAVHGDVCPACQESENAVQVSTSVRDVPEAAAGGDAGRASDLPVVPDAFHQGTVEAVAEYVEHLRDDFQSTTEPVKKVARLIRERFSSRAVPGR